MKYREGNIVLLNNNATVYIMAVNKEEQKYQVFDTEDSNEVFEISENDIIMKVT